LSQSLGLADRHRYPIEDEAVAYFEDLSNCDYFGDDLASELTAIAWLTNDVAFSTGKTPDESYAKLKLLLIDPWQPMIFGGCHDCELCQFDRPYGHSNLFVPNGSLIFVCPEMILHYIAAHHYRPPDQFLAAVAECPNTHTMDYKKLLLSSGGRNLLRGRG
jgi:hypothetical protein